MADQIAQKAGKLASIIRVARTNPVVRTLAMKIIQGVLGGPGVPEFGYEQEVDAIHTWVRDNIRYTRDPVRADLFENPLWTLKAGAGDCDAMTTLEGSLLESIGSPVRVKTVSYDGSEFTHVYLLGGSSFKPLDPTLPHEPPGMERPYRKARVFSVE